MHLALINGKVVFASHIITVDTIMDETIKDKLSHIVLEGNQIVCYSENDKDEIELELKASNIKYDTKKCVVQDDHKKKCQNINYLNRTEAIAHIQSNCEPEHIKNERMNQEKELKINELEATIKNQQKMIDELYKLIGKSKT